MEVPEQLRGVLIDMDGVLLDTERVANRCWQAAEVETGFSMPPGFYDTLIGQSMTLCEERLHAVMEPGCDVQAFLKAAHAHYFEAITRQAIPVKLGARELLARLHGKRIPVCLVTSTFREMASRKLELTGLHPFLIHRVCGDEVAHSKPDPAIYRKGADKLGKDPSTLLAVEDSENGLRSALSAGCCVVHVPDMARVSLEVQMQARHVYRSLFEIIAALDRGELFLEGW